MRILLIIVFLSVLYLLTFASSAEEKKISGSKNELKSEKKIEPVLNKKTDLKKAKIKKVAAKKAAAKKKTAKKSAIKKEKNNKKDIKSKKKADINKKKYKDKKVKHKPKKIKLKSKYNNEVVLNFGSRYYPIKTKGWLSITNYKFLFRWARSRNLYLVDDRGPVINRRAAFVSNFGAVLNYDKINPHKSYYLLIDFVRFKSMNNINIVSRLNIFINGSLVDELKFGQISAYTLYKINIPRKLILQGKLKVVFEEISNQTGYWGIWDIILTRYPEKVINQKIKVENNKYQIKNTKQRVLQRRKDPEKNRKKPFKPPKYGKQIRQHVDKMKKKFIKPKKKDKNKSEKDQFKINEPTIKDPVFKEPEIKKSE